MVSELGHEQHHASQGVWVLGFLLALGCGGCGAAGDSTPRYPVTGTVLLEGAPVDGAVVAFSRDDGKVTAAAMTDELGKFNLYVPPGKKGVPEGKYLISVRKSAPAPVSQEPTTFEAMEREHKAGIKAAPRAEPKSGVPTRYGDPATSQLVEEVLPGENNFTIELKG